MIFTAETKALKDALAIAGRVVPIKSPWPVAMYVRVTADGTAIRLRGTNMDMTFEATVAAEVEEQGETLLPFATLSNFVKAGKSDAITLKHANGDAKINCGRSRIGLLTLDPSDFPDLPAPATGLFSLEVSAFAQALRFCAAAASDSEVKYHIKGVMIEEHDGNLDLWGTDGQVMNHACMIGVPEIGGGGQITQDAIQTVLAMAGKSEAMSFAISDKGWIAEVGECRAWGKVIEDRYVDARGLMEKLGECELIATAETADILVALDVAECGADGANKVRHVVLRSEGEGPLIVRGYRAGTSLSEVGRAEVGDTKAPMAAAYASEYLRDLLGGMGSRVDLEVADSHGSTILRAQANPQLDLLRLEGVVYPIRTSAAEVA